MQEINCREFGSLLAEYVDGSLVQDTRKRMASHSLQCRSCRIVLDDVKVKLREGGRDSQVITNPRLEAVLELIPEAESDLSCPNFEELISDFLDGFVHASVYHRFARHSDACSRCSRVLTDVVYAVAACHSVHIYEEQEVPGALASRLTAIGAEDQKQAEPASTQMTDVRDRSMAGRSRAGLSGLRSGFYRMLPTSSVERAATVCGLVLASLAIAVFGPARDTIVAGMFKKAQSRATSFYNHGVDIYSQRQVVEARFERVGEDLGRVWKALGGTDSINGGDDDGTRVPGHEQIRAGGQGR